MKSSQNNLNADRKIFKAWQVVVDLILCRISWYCVVSVGIVCAIIYGHCGENIDIKMSGIVVCMMLGILVEIVLK